MTDKAQCGEPEAFVLCVLLEQGTVLLMVVVVVMAWTEAEEQSIKPDRLVLVNRCSQ